MDESPQLAHTSPPTCGSETSSSVSLRSNKIEHREADEGLLQPAHVPADQRGREIEVLEVHQGLQTTHVSGHRCD